MELVNWGFLGLFIGTFLSATILPFPSDVIVIGIYEAGYSITPCLVVATVGNLLGVRLTPLIVMMFIGKFIRYFILTMGYLYLYK